MSVGELADHAQDLARRRLLFQRLFVSLEQPHVLNGDHSLVGEGLKERDLLVAERQDLGAADPDRPDRIAIAKQRHTQDRPITDSLCQIASGRIVTRLNEILDLDDP